MRTDHTVIICLKALLAGLTTLWICSIVAHATVVEHASGVALRWMTAVLFLLISTVLAWRGSNLLRGKAPLRDPLDGLLLVGIAVVIFIAVILHANSEAADS